MAIADATVERSPGSARFDAIERVVHWVNATLFLTLLTSGAALYGLPLTGWIGNRDLVKEIHVWVGLALPVPILLGIATSPALRADIHRVSRWTRDKFNRGQMANTAFVGASIVVMLGTGLMMRWPGPFSNDWREGATFVHDSFFFLLGVVIVGHIGFALTHPVSLRAMLFGGATPSSSAALPPAVDCAAAGDPPACDPTASGHRPS